MQTYHNLAATYHAQRKFRGAEKLYKNTLEARRQELGSEHTENLKTMHNLGATYQSQKKFDEARKLREETITIRKRVFGVDHPATLADA